MTLFDFTLSIRSIAKENDTTRSNAKDMFLTNVRLGVGKYRGAPWIDYQALSENIKELEDSQAEWAEENGAGAI